MKPQYQCIFLKDLKVTAHHHVCFKRIQEFFYVIITLYVDDLILAFNDLILLKETKDNLFEKNWNGEFMWDLILIGDINKLCLTRLNNLFKEKKYIGNILRQFGMVENKLI